MNKKQKENIYGFIYGLSNSLCCILLTFVAIFLIFRFIRLFELRIILSIISFIGAAFFEERMIINGAFHTLAFLNMSKNFSG